MPTVRSETGFGTSSGTERTPVGAFPLLRTARRTPHRGGATRYLLTSAATHVGILAAAWTFMPGVAPPEPAPVVTSSLTGQRELDDPPPPPDDLDIPMPERVEDDVRPLEVDEPPEDPFRDPEPLEIAPAADRSLARESIRVRLPTLPGGASAAGGGPGGGSGSEPEPSGDPEPPAEPEAPDPTGPWCAAQALSGNAGAVYPQRAKQRGWEGSVLLRLLVDAQGRVADVEIVESSGHDVLDEAAAEAVRAWRFRPAHRGATACASRVLQKFDFVLVRQ